LSIDPTKLGITIQNMQLLHGGLFTQL